MVLVPKLLSFEDIKAKFPKHKRHQLRYAMREYEVKPCKKVGTFALYTEEDVARVASALRRVADNRRC